MKKTQTGNFFSNVEKFGNFARNSSVTFLKYVFDLFAILYIHRMATVLENKCAHGERKKHS